MSTKGRILIVDDVPTNVDILRRILRKDYDLETAASGEECLAKLAAFDPQLVLLDIMMPGIDGFETCRRIKASDRGGSIQVILVSGKGSLAERLNGYASQADDYVIKPFDHEEMLSKVRVHLRLAVAQRQLKETLGVRTDELMKANQELYNEVQQRRQAEEELTQQAVVLQEANAAAVAATRAKSEFLANMSHEIRTPMTAILGFAELLLDEVESNSVLPDRIEAIRTIQRNGNHLLELIKDILDLSKIEAGKLTIEQIRCSPREILTEVAGLMQIRADAKGLPLEIECAGSIPVSIRSDPRRLRQILINLLGNAIKFTETGKVRVVASSVREFSGPSMLRFDIIDTGIGISATTISELFQPFNQGDSSATRRFGGTGLGLTISKRLAETLGGNIRVESVPGQGSTFSLTIAVGNIEEIPLLERPAGAIDPTARRSCETNVAAIHLDCRILLAEDGPDNQRLITFLLKKAGAEVTVVENGRHALEQALAAWKHGRAFDVILMDMQMPVMDGYTAVRTLREHGYGGPIISLTAHAMAEDRQLCLNAGCDDYVTKPIDRQTLLASVARWIVRNRSDEHESQPSSQQALRDQSPR